ncbi:hypothetical protein SAMN05720469_102172 [Fibrobacter intestinalis]|uniref:Uncharacterized protein n=1 Tax=Fibrobacter intestinalis TaxID=28122 RepID=A0A1M6QNB1_9BACT|nr:hypothetical protein [Fibrobacter intestinalis]MDD7298176.1 hypothetical protein [Fibrobacter intestinalis]SHK21762.1 hypothetical protein SAMN05720469_102172 [Fibrobacter intestinalis]
MWVILFKTLEGVDYYGDRPDAPEDGDPRAEFYDFDINREYWNILETDFINPVNDLCGSLLDFDEDDFFCVEQCVKLKTWIEKRFQQETCPALKPVYEKILEYAIKAIDLGTGIIIQF